MATFPEQAITLASHRAAASSIQWRGEFAGGENLRRVRGSQGSRMTRLRGDFGRLV